MMLIQISWHLRVVLKDWTQILTNPLLNINVHSAKPGLSSSMKLAPGEHMGQPALLTLKGPIPYIYGTQVWLSLCLQMS